MLYDVDQVILSIEDEPMKIPGKLKLDDRGERITDKLTGQPATEMVPLTLGLACRTALLADLPGDKDLTPDQRLELFQMALAMKLGGEVELSHDEVATIQKRLAKAWNTYVFGACHVLLEHGAKVSSSDKKKGGARRSKKAA